MIAFSDYVRTVIWLIYKYLVTLTVIKSGLYDRVYLSLDWKSRDLVSKVEERVTKMKADVKAARQRRIKAQNKHSDAADEASQGSEATDGSGARLNSTAVDAADGSAAPVARHRSRPPERGVDDAEGDANHHVVNIHDFGAPGAMHEDNMA